MTALGMDYPLKQISRGTVDEMQVPVYQAKTIYAGAMVSLLTASGYATDPTYGTTGAVQGVAQAQADNSSGSSGDVNVNLLTGTFARPNHGSHAVAITHVGKVVYASDNNTVSSTSTDGPVAGLCVGFTSDATPEVLVFIHPELNYLLSQATLSSNLASVVNGLGASLVAIEDAGTFTSAATVEAALAEIYTHLFSATTSIPLSLHQFREVDANGDVGNIAANGGILASDTTPVLRGNAAESTEIYWAAGNSDPISTQITLPTDFDGTKDATIDMWLSSGTTDAATITVETGWDGGALVSDSTSDAATKSATAHKITVTINAGDIPNTAALLTIALTPPAHTTDGIILTGIRFNYKRKLLTA